jgi:hypothetical protein
MTVSFAEVRDDVVSYVRRQLVGPFTGPAEVIADTPNRRYLMGILFPRAVALEEYAEQEGEQSEITGGTGSGEENQFSDESVSAANDFLPASQGLSFFTSASALQVQVRGAVYETLEGAAAEAATAEAEIRVEAPTEQQDHDPRRRRTRRVWRRRQLEQAPVTIDAHSDVRQKVLEKRGELHVRWRNVAGGSLVTVTLVNAITAADPEVQVDRLWDDMLLQVEIQIDAADGAILEYPSLSAASHDPEEEELRLQHQAARVYAIGHGCAVRWNTGAAITSLFSEVMPQHEVAKVSARELDADGNPVPPARALDIAWLADLGVGAEELHQELERFVDHYGTWIAGQVAAADRLVDSRQQDAARRIVERLRVAEQRMRRGAKLLKDDEDVRLAFRLANEAMLQQMRHSAQDLAGSRRARASAAELPTSYPAGRSWFPFQLGFALLSMTGLAAPPQHDIERERDVVDLIWFPTGGGKTEAYLLLAAFEIFRRRLVHGAGGAGTVVISRYTLTLLTTQQFQRAATTICAAERIRIAMADRLGTRPISIGLWVGDPMTPNRYKAANSAVEAIKEDNRPENRFVLERCPWCGTEILPRERSDDLNAYGITATDTSFAFHCTNDRCPFHTGLPVHVVDDDLYDHPPTFLLGTVDKFAGLAWEPRSGVFFGRSAGHRPPSLIIQDELHLLTGPLGTTVGLYEAAIQLLCEHEGRGPKVISSTATIRRAPDQVLGLFGRSVQLFPPSGLSADDSHFAKVDRSVPGRLFVGLMAQGHTADTATVHAVTAMLQAPTDLGLSGPARDAYWTLVAYHSSLRELGRTVTIARDDVTTRLKALITTGREIRAFDVDEITSNVPRSQQADLLERLNRTCDEKEHLGFVASTNMLSVGVDVPRLGLMLMNGQPKATAEYIQATSRVGRDIHPGLVFSLFRSTRPRDRSHYENFLPYHGALYRFVEPTSVTPWSPPSRDRALHAALVILVRHHLGLASDDKAGRVVDVLPAVAACIERLVATTAAVETREASRTRVELQRFVDDWVERAGRATSEGKTLYYAPNGRGQVNLLQDFDRKVNAWQTLRSMRNVDRESVLDIVKAGPASTPRIS